MKVYTKRAVLQDKKGSPVDCLVPTSQHDHSELCKIKLDTHLYVEVRRQRSIHHHRLYWAMIRKTLDNIDGFKSVETLSDYILIKIGHCDLIELANNVLCAKPKSISFTQCEQGQFSKLFTDAVKHICDDKNLLIGTNPQDLIDEVMLDTKIN